MLKISVYVLTYNNERTIERCLKSVRWADEVVVVDHNSADRTPEICRRYTEHFYQKEWTNYRDEYNYAVTLARHDWVMFLDSDEEISKELAQEIQGELRYNDGRWAGYDTPRMTYYLGRWIRHGEWYPDYKIRLYDRTKGRWEGRALHPRIQVNGAVKRLTSDCLHYNYRDISDQIQTIDRYSEMAAQVLDEEQASAGFLKMLLHPPFRFFRDYFLRRGFLDGLPGFIIAVSTMYYVFIKYAKLWERQRGLKKG
jgi:glycosyltransferase involved in cell wall biosynthesis